MDLRAPLAFLCLLVAAPVGCDDASASRETKDAPKSAADEREETADDPPEAPAVRLVHFGDENGRRGLTCEVPAGSEPIHCGVLASHDSLHLGGPIGTRIRIDDEEYVLSKEQSLDPKEAKRLLRNKLTQVSNVDAYLELPYPGPAVLGREVDGLCSKGKKDGPGHVFQIEVRLPGSDAPLRAFRRQGRKENESESTLTEPWWAIRSAMARRLEKAVESEDGELPPLTDGANGAIFLSTCYGGEAQGLSDLRYVVRKIEAYEDESLRRKKKCGTYRSKNNYVKTLAHTMSDVRAEIWDVRAKKVVAKKTFRAATPKCPKKITQSSSGEYSSPDSDVVHDWVKSELGRRAGPPIASE